MFGSEAYTAILGDKIVFETLKKYVLYTLNLTLENHFNEFKVYYKIVVNALLGTYNVTTYPKEIYKASFSDRTCIKPGNCALKLLRPP